MRELLRVTYLNCGFCVGKNHCKSCGRELSEALASRPGIRGAEVSVPDHTAAIDHDLDRGALEDLLDGMGLMAE